MKVILIILSLLSLSSFAKDLLPTAPEGWAVMNSLEPVILTWAHANPEKKLEEVPTVMVQEYKFEGKIKALFETKTLKKDCFSEVSSGWDQTWCHKEDTVYVVLARGDKKLYEAPVKKLMNWVHGP